jgi:hypothetical protein
MNLRRAPLEPCRDWRRWPAVVLALVLGFSACAFAAEGSQPVSWSDLGKEEQRVLAPHADTWARLDAQTREQLLRGARRWLSLTPDERAAAADRFARWQSLPVERREQIRERYRAFRELPPDQQRQLKRQFERFRYLPPQQREELRRRFESMTPEERRGFLTGLRASRQAEDARRARSWVPQQDRAATRAMIESLTPPERLKLRRIMQGQLPEDRRTLHRQLLQMSADERRAWIGRQPEPRAAASGQ